MRPKKLTLSLETPALDNVATDQQTVGAASLTLDGSLASGGTVTLTTAHRLDIESAGNISGVNFTITGTGSNGQALTETIAGPNATTVTTTNYFLTITDIATDGAVGTDVSVGTTNEAVSPWYPVNWRAENFLVGLDVLLSGTINATVDYTGKNVLADGVPADDDSPADIHAHDTLAAITSSDYSNYIIPVMATRLKINSFSSGATASLTIIQGN